VAKSEIVIKASNSGIKRTEDPLSYSYLKLTLTTANRHRIYKQLLKIIFFHVLNKLRRVRNSANIWRPVIAM